MTAALIPLAAAALVLLAAAACAAVSLWRDRTPWQEVWGWGDW